MEGARCVICCEAFHEPCTLLCGHSFCRECIELALQSSTRCPVCRTTVPAGEVPRVNVDMQRMLSAAAMRKRRFVPLDELEPCDGGNAYTWHGHRVEVVRRPREAWAHKADTALSEVDLVAQLRHPHVACLYGTHITEREVVSVREALGESLRDWCAREARERAQGSSCEHVVELMRTMADAVRFAHKRGVVHGNLTVDSFRFHAQSGALKLGGFGPWTCAVVGASAQTRLGDLVHMAPERVRGVWASCESDVFSLGVVFHRMLTLAPFEPPQITPIQLGVLRRELRHSLLGEAAAAHMPTWLAHMLASMLQGVPAQRMGMARVCSVLEQGGPPLVYRREHFPAPPVMPSVWMPAPADGEAATLRAVVFDKAQPVAPQMHALHRAVALRNEAVLESVLEPFTREYVREVALMKGDSPFESKELVSALLNMLPHCTSERMVVCVLLSLKMLGRNRANKVHIADSGGIPRLLTAMMVMADCTPVQRVVADTLCNLAVNHDNKSELVQNGALSHIFQAITMHIANADVVESGCAALGNLCGNDTVKVRLAQLGGIELLTGVMEVHAAAPSVLEQVIGCYWNLSVNDTNALSIARVGALERVLQALRTHHDHHAVVKSSCGCLSNLACDQRLKTQIRELGGVEDMLMVVRMSDDPFTLERAVSCLRNLAVLTTNRPHILKLGALSLLHVCMCKYGEHAQLMEQCFSLLWNVCSVKGLPQPSTLPPDAINCGRCIISTLRTLLRRAAEASEGDGTPSELFSSGLGALRALAKYHRDVVLPFFEEGMVEVVLGVLERWVAVGDLMFQALGCLEVIFPQPSDRFGWDRVPAEALRRMVDAHNTEEMLVRVLSLHMQQYRVCESACLVLMRMGPAYLDTTSTGTLLMVLQVLESSPSVDLQQACVMVLEKLFVAAPMLCRAGINHGALPLVLEVVAAHGARKPLVQRAGMAVVRACCAQDASLVTEVRAAGVSTRGLK